MQSLGVLSCEVSYAMVTFELFLIVSNLPTMAVAKKRASTVVDLAVEAKNFTKLAEALTQAQLVDTLKGKGPFTVFAPNDDAFKKLSRETWGTLMKPANRSKLQNILKLHVASGRKSAKDVLAASSMKMMDGTSLNITNEDGQPRIGGARIQTTDLEAENGVVHVIDRVLSNDR